MTTTIMGFALWFVGEVVGVMRSVVGGVVYGTKGIQSDGKCEMANALRVYRHRHRRIAWGETVHPPVRPMVWHVHTRHGDACTV
jgi:hypothetical protein